MSEEVKSPCNNKCKIYSYFCISCYRTLNEICCWSYLTDEEKSKIIDSLKIRQKYLP